MFIVCPQCGTLVVPGRDGTCPACRHPIQAAESRVRLVDAVFEGADPEVSGQRRSAAAGPGSRGGEPELELRAPRRGLLGVLAAGLLGMVLALEVTSGRGNLLTYGFLAFLTLAVLPQLRLLLLPPRLALREGHFEVRGLRSFRVPAEDVADLRLYRGHPLVILEDCGRVEPAGVRPALVETADRQGFHAALPRGSFDRQQLERFRQALRLPVQPEPQPEPEEVFEDLLQRLTPRAFITPALVLVNVALFGWLLLDCWRDQMLLEQKILVWGANYGPLTTSGQWWRLLSSLFLHFNLLHVGFNMWVLWDVGRMVERLVGNLAFLVVYLTAGFFGSLASVLWNPPVVSAGASGAVFGVFGLLLGFLLPRRDSVPLEVIKEHRSSITAFLVLNLLLGLSIEWIDMAAHVGGLAAGFVCGLLLTQPLSLRARGRRRLRTALVAVLAAAAGAASVHFLLS